MAVRIIFSAPPFFFADKKAQKNQPLRAGPFKTMFEFLKSIFA